MIHLRKTELYIVIVALVLFSGCKTLKLQFSAAPLSPDHELQANSLVYALPRTSIRVTLEVKKLVEKRGPFYEYREKYLGIREGIEEDRTIWEISDISVDSYEGIDPERYYVVETNGTIENNYLAMSRAGLVLSPEARSYETFPALQTMVREKPEPVFFTDLSVKRNKEVITEESFRITETDTGFIRVPYNYDRIVWKNTEEKAEEATNFIIKIRKRRFKLMAGQYDVFPEGIALQYAVEEMTRLEEEYLALFIGKSWTEVYRMDYEIIPTPVSIQRASILCRFSPAFGVVGEDDLSGFPVAIDIRPESFTTPLQNISIPGTEEQQDTGPALFYRIPEVAQIRITNGKETLAAKRVLVYQLGKTIQLPVNVILK